IWPADLSLWRRAESPCPGQSKMTTEKPLAWSSRATSKYFSMNSVRPGQTSTVPRVLMVLSFGSGANRRRHLLPPFPTYQMTSAPSGGGWPGTMTRSWGFCSPVRESPVLPSRLWPAPSMAVTIERLAQLGEELLQLHGDAHVAGDFQLARHVGHHRI